MKIGVLRPDPYHQKGGLLVPYLTQRVLAYAQAHMPWVDPTAFTKGVMARIMAGDPATMLLALVNEEGAVVGHILASLGGDGVKQWCSINQYRADTDANVGDKGLEALDTVYKWAISHGIYTILINTTDKNVKRWLERGFEHQFQTLSRTVNPTT